MLTVDNLHKRFGQVTALDGLSFDAHHGRILGFLGPNGAGKTTAMRAMLGLVVPDAGSVRYAEAPVGPKERLRCGYMPEERGLYPKMKVKEQLAYFARLSGVEKQTAAKTADEWLERFGLADRADDKARGALTRQSAARAARGLPRARARCGNTRRAVRRARSSRNGDDGQLAA